MLTPIVTQVLAADRRRRLLAVAETARLLKRAKMTEDVGVRVSPAAEPHADATPHIARGDVVRVLERSRV